MNLTHEGYSMVDIVNLFLPLTCCHITNTLGGGIICSTTVSHSVYDECITNNKYCGGVYDNLKKEIKNGSKSKRN